MEFHHFYIFTLFLVAIVGTHAEATSSELYWKTVLPNTTMPKAVKDLLNSAAGEVFTKVRPQFDFFDYEEYQHAKNVIPVPSSSPVAATKYAGEDEAGDVPTDLFDYEEYARADDHHHHPLKEDDSAFSSSSLRAATKDSGEGLYFDHDEYVQADAHHPHPLNEDDSPFSYGYDASKNPLKNKNHPFTLFFLEKDLRIGTEMNLNFAKSRNPAVFLPREKADSIPFSSRKMPEIYSKLSVNPTSTEARVIKKTVLHCEKPGIKGEEIYCATSLESMIDFSTSRLGKNIDAVSTESENATQLQKYTVEGPKKLAGNTSVVCHKQNYPYAVFYCHKTYATQAYLVSLAGNHGARAEAAAVCHQDTSAWNPKHLAFLLLKVEPGTVPICHFLPKDHIVWNPK